MTSGHARRDISRRTSFVIALTVFSVIYVANSWVGDDAYISFRVSDNLINGYGLRWNVAERVQVYTHPLWMFLMAAAGWVTGELFYTSQVVSGLFLVAVLAILWRWLERDVDRWLVFVLLLSSKAFIDYSSSGLEYPLSYLLITVFTILLLKDADAVSAGARLPLFVFIASLGFVTRFDTILLYLPALLWLSATRLRLLGRREAGWLALASFPVWGWLLFTLVYYGSPVPNVYYAKASFGAPRWLQIEQGLAYVASSVRFDPITLASTVAATGVAWAASRARERLLALGACAYVAYTIWVGGDFMAGRFFALPFLVSALLLATLPKTRRTASVALALLLLLNVVNPLAPVKTIPFSDIGWNWRFQNGVKDDRGATFKQVNPLFHEVFRRVPDTPTAREGMSFAASPEPVLVHPWIGKLGYFAGPQKFIIDPNALSDPLLARLPVGQHFYFEFWVSHWTRTLPEGYLESRQSGTNLIRDPLIRELYDKILNVTTGPIFSVSRFRDIFDLNVGRFRNVHVAVRRGQRLDYVAKVNNPLFRTDAGELDPRSGLIRALGKSGYLLFGPGIPLDHGTYEVQWKGTTERTGADLGFVEACSNGCRNVLARQPIWPWEGTLGTLPVAVGADVRDIEFRMYVNADSRIQLESLHIKQR